MACPTLDTKLERACTSGIAKVRDPVMLRQLIAQNLCGASLAASVVIRDLVSFTSAVAGPAFESGSYTPTPNALVLAMVVNEGGAAAVPTGFFGNGLAWQQVATQAWTGPFSTFYQVTVFRAMGTPTAGTGAVTFGVAQSLCIIRVLEFSGVNTSGSNGSGAVAQSGTASGIGTANPSLNLAALNASGRNTVIAFSGNIANPYGATTKSGWTIYFNSGVAGAVSAGAFITYQQSSLDNAILLTKASNNWGLIGVEIQAA